MAIKHIFNGRTVVEPGAYSQIVGGTTPKPVNAAFGKATIIDTGKGSAFGFKSGIMGELAEGKNSIYEFSDPVAVKQAVRGGIIYDLADYLFSPSSNGRGIDSLKIVSASKTTKSEMEIVFTGSAWITRTGTITTSNSSDQVTGVDTKFLTELSVGDTIADDATDTLIGTIESIESDTALTLVANAASSNSGIAYSSKFKQTQGGTLKVSPLTEGVCANGYMYGGKLIKGFAMSLESGVVDTSKFVLKFLNGKFAGVNELAVDFPLNQWDDETTYSIGQIVVYNGIAFKSLLGANLNKNPFDEPTYWEVYLYNDNYGDNDPSQVDENLIITSPEFSNLIELTNWMENNADFLSSFKLTSKVINGEGKVDDGDLAANAEYIVASGGETRYSSEALDMALENLVEDDSSFILSLDFGLSAKGTANSKILTYINDEADFEKGLIIGGGHNKAQLSTTSGSVGICQYFNSSKVAVVHGGIFVPKYAGGEKELNSLYHAALYLGRTAGLEPQVPTTWKDIRILKPVHELSKKERESALMYGVIHTRFVDGKGWVINQSINTLQRNGSLILPDGDSYEMSIERIKWQLNKELIINSRILFVGGNLSTASAEDVKTFAEGYLYSKTVVNGQDNLIMSFKDVKVTLVGDAWSVTYGFVPNSPVNKLFYTGTMLDPNISI